MSSVKKIPRSNPMRPCPKCGCPDELYLDSSGIANASWIDCANCENRLQKDCAEETLVRKWNALDRSRMPEYTDPEQGDLQ